MHATTAVWRWSEHCLRCFWFIRFAPCPNVYFSNYRAQRPQTHNDLQTHKSGAFAPMFLLQIIAVAVVQQLPVAVWIPEISVWQ